MSDPIVRLNAALEGRVRIEREFRWGRMARVIARLTVAALGWPIHGTAVSAQVPPPMLTLGDEVQVSHERPGVPHIESHIAADPSDPDHLVTVSITFTATGEATSTSFASFDGGRSWRHAPLTGCRGVDPWVDFGAGGRVYASCLSRREVDGVGVRSVVDVFRSADGGRTWAGPAMVPLGEGTSSDRTFILVDRTQGERSGTVYQIRGQSVQRDSGQFWFGPSISRSDDGGLTFSEPLILELNNLENGPQDAAVLPDGGLAILFVDWSPRNRYERAVTFVRSQRSWTIVSDDGGRTFSAPKVVAEHSASTSASTIAVDPSPARLGRWYVLITASLTQRPTPSGDVWVFEDGIPADVYLMYSDDRGESWSAPTRVNDNQRQAKHEEPMVSVNDQGVVGVAWYDRRHASAADCYDVYFSASMDGGESFLPNIRVSTTTSCQKVSGNVISDPNGQRDIAERWQTGGDYSGIAAAADGRFHVVWADSRTGLYQLWTRSVRVSR